VNNISAVVIYQPYEPFDKLLPEILWDLYKQTVDVKIYIAGQPPIGLIQKGKLYDQKVDKINSDYIFFTDVDAKLPKELIHSMHVNMLHNDLDIVFAMLGKSDIKQSACDGIFMLKKELWLEWRQQEEFKEFLEAKGIPTFLPLFLKWCCDNKKIGYEHDCPVGLRLPGNSARGHQRHEKTKNKARFLARDLTHNSSWISVWSLIDGKWQKALPAKDNRV